MESVPPDGERGPLIKLTQVLASSGGAGGHWNVGWQIQNQGAAALKVFSVRLPHKQFRAAEHRFAPALDLAPDQKTEFSVAVACNEPAGLVTENAFLIFHVVWVDEQWRIFVRIRLKILDDGKPDTQVESITTQKVGFSGVAL